MDSRQTKSTLATLMAFAGVGLGNGRSGPSEHPHVRENGAWVQKKVTPVWVWVKGKQCRRYRAEDGTLYTKKDVMSR